MNDNYPRFYAAHRTIMSPPYIAFQWKDDKDRRCTQILASYETNEEADELARRCNIGLRGK